MSLFATQTFTKKDHANEKRLKISRMRQMHLFATRRPLKGRLIFPDRQKNGKRRKRLKSDLHSSDRADIIVVDDTRGNVRLVSKLLRLAKIVKDRHRGKE